MMKRNMVLIRKILEWSEANAGSDCSIEIDCYTSKEVSYHLKLCKDTELLEYEDKVERGKNPRVVGHKVNRITWKGMTCWMSLGVAQSN